jgi:hypothetical protein
LFFLDILLQLVDKLSSIREFLGFLGELVVQIFLLGVQLLLKFSLEFLLCGAGFAFIV